MQQKKAYYINWVNKPVWLVINLKNKKYHTVETVPKDYIDVSLFVFVQRGGNCSWHSHKMV